MADTVASEDGLARDTTGLLEGAAGRIRLSKCDSERGLSAAARALISSRLKAWARDPQVYAVVWDSLSDDTWSTGHGSADTEWDRHAFTWLLECFSKPTAALLHGAARLGGSSLFSFATHRVATTGFQLSFDQLAANRLPDCGVTWLLSRLPRNIGLHLAMTGLGIGAGDARRLGLVTHVVAADQLPIIVARLVEADPIDQVLDPLDVGSVPETIWPHAASISHCFSAQTLDGILERLSDAADSGEAWASQSLRAMASVDRPVLQVGLRMLRHARTLDLRETLMRDAAMIGWWEGLDGSQRERMSEDVALSACDDFLAGWREHTASLPTRREMQDWRFVSGR